MIGDSNRTVLYYPTIDIPNKRWLRQALLYWDNIASIVPQDYENNALVPYTTEIKYLLNQKIFKPIRPDKLYSESRKLTSDFKKELIDIIESEEYTNYIGSKENWIIKSRIHKNKVSYPIFQYLSKKELVNPKIHREDNNEWYLFEFKTALLYMSLLARYLSEIEKEFTIPSTDNEIYRNLIFYPNKSDKRSICTETLFKNILPVPNDDVKIEDIINFKNDHNNELLKFRKEVKQFQDKIGLAKSKKDIQEITTIFAEECKINIEDLNQLLQENNIQFSLDTLKTFIKNKTFLAAISSLGAVGIGRIFNIDIPIEWSAVPTVIIGSIEIGGHWLKSRLRKTQLLRKSAFSYLYQAEKLV